MEVPPSQSSMAGQSFAPVETDVVTTTVTNAIPTGSVVEVIASGPLVDQSSNLITDVLSSGSFTLVNLDLEPLQLDQTPQQQLEGEKTEEGDVFDDGVNLVVKGSWWWCKDCNTKQKFGCGESIEDHLSRRHSTRKKTEEAVDPKSRKNHTHVDQFRQPCARQGSSSDVISSVYTIPSDRVQDQSIETFIVIDGSTTVQVITEQTDDNGVLLSSADDENRTVDTSQDSLKTFSSCGPPDTDVSGGPAHVAQTLSEMKPIPVLPALQLTDMQPPPPPPPLASVSSSAKTPGKESKSFSLNLSEIKSSNMPPSHPSSEESGANVALVSSNSDSGRNEIHTGDKTHAYESDTLRKPSLSNTAHHNMVTRKNISHRNRKNMEGVQLKKCSVYLTRLTLEEIKENSRKTSKYFPRSKSKTVSQRTAKQMKDTEKSISFKARLSSKKSEKENTCLTGNLQLVSGAKTQIFSTNIQSDVSIRKEHTSCSIKKRTASGRQIRKPVRYLTESENEEEEQQPDEQPQYVSTTSSSTKSPHPEQNPPQNPSRYPKKRRMSSAAEAEMQTPDTVPKTVSKKARDDEKYCCEDCGRRFRFENKLEKHRKLYAGQTMQQCSVCDVALHNQDLLNVHIYHVHLTKESTSCLKCSKVLGSKRNLLNHLLTHSGMEGQNVANLIRDSCAVHECSVCDEPIVIGEGRVDRHYLIHEKPNMCVCQKCGQSFRHKKELYSHLKTHGTLDEAVQHSADQSDIKQGGTNSSHDSLPTNPMSMTHTEKLDVHSVSLHTDDKVIAESVKQIMKFEESTSTDSEVLMTQTFLSGDTEKPETRGQQSSQTTKPLIHCELCRKQFTTKKLLYQHLKVHGSEAPDFPDRGEAAQVCCEQDPVTQPVDLTAGVPFGIPCTLVKLERIEKHENLLRKSFTTTLEGLVVPSQIHYSCALCEKEFESESKARRHVLRFSHQQNILQCNLCPGRFHNLDLFNVHYVYVHQPSGAATCMTCKMDFNNKGDFITHLGNSPLSHPLSHKMGFSTFIQDACGSVTCSVCQKSMWNYPLNIANHTRKHRNLCCPICQQELPYKYALFLHLQIHANSRNCHKLSERELQQNEQIENLHRIVTEIESSALAESCEKFCCSFCEGEILCTRKNIHQHLDLHARKVLHSVREGRYFCPDCGEDITVSDQSISDHLSSHGHSQALFVCIFCSLTFGSFDEFKEHESKKHWLNVYFEKNMCEVCGKEFVSRQQFQKHIKLHEEKQGLFSCSHCKQTFRFESKLQKHMAKHKKGSYACQFCGKLYMTKISLDRHEQVVHIGIKDFKHKCKLCDAQFINATHLRDHVTNKHTSGTSYKCLQCGMGFQYLSTFARHKRVVHGGDTPYVCQECGEKFPQKKHLQRHMIAHTGINPFQCPACPKSFGLERTMKEHFDFCHQGIQKFICPSCGSKFPRKRSLKRHMETCRMSGVPHVESGSGFTKVPVEIRGMAKQQNAGLVVIQQI